MQRSQFGTKLFITTFVIYFVIAVLCVGAAWIGTRITHKLTLFVLTPVNAV